MIENQRIMLLSVGGKNENFCKADFFFKSRRSFFFLREKYANLSSFSFTVY